MVLGSSNKEGTNNKNKLRMTTHPIEARGPDGEELTIDVGIVGATEPSRAVVVLSGVHGVEGFAGTGCSGPVGASPCAGSGSGALRRNPDGSGSDGCDGSNGAGSSGSAGERSTAPVAPTPSRAAAPPSSGSRSSSGTVRR